MHRAILSLLSAAAIAPFAAGQTTLEFLEPGFLITDLSEDGSAGAGNVAGDGSYETFRWTRAGGVERLGLATVPVLGTGAGSPDISYDGTRVSATILSSDGNATQGIWDAITGWQETMPPLPVGGRILDRSYGSAWGLSGDGAVLTGFYWSTDRAQSCRWSAATGMVALPKDPGRSARVNAASFDGSVAVGWEEHSTGAWQPTAWRGLTKLRLSPSDASAEATAVNADGSIIVGKIYDPAQATRAAAIWRWDGSAYSMQVVGFLPGTVVSFGQAYFDGVSDDGRIAVGTNIYTQSPGGPRDGLVWTPETGLVKDTEWLASLGVALPPEMDIVQLNAVSPDGSTVAGIAQRTDTFQFQTFLVRLGGACPADLTGDGLVDFADYLEFLNAYDSGDLRVDYTGDGLVDFADYLEFLNLYDAGC